MSDDDRKAEEESGAPAADDDAGAADSADEASEGNGDAGGDQNGGDGDGNGEAGEGESTAAGDATADDDPKKRRPKKRAKSKPPPTEREIDSPNRLTLQALGIVFAITFFSWGAARFACNLHPPESHPPPPAETSKLAATAKGAALEMQHRLKTLDFKGALELADGPIVEIVRRAQADCEKTAAECARQRGELSDGRVTTTAILRSQTGSEAEAEVTSHVRDVGAEKYRMSLKRDGAIWKVTSREQL